jgi:hypothetical protein
MLRTLLNCFAAMDWAAGMQGAPCFELHFRPDVPSATVVRRFVADMYQRFLSDSEAASRIALATHELLENAARYAKGGETTLRIEVDLEQQARPITIELRNRAEPANIAAIREILDGLAGAPSASTFYQQLLMRRVQAKDRSRGLGLARICAECDMRLTCRVVDDDVSIIEATTAIGDRAEP